MWAPGGHWLVNPGEDDVLKGRAGGARGGRFWGSGGSSPRVNTASRWRRRPKVAKHRATPGGYGGKPPGVAFIGVPTGARNAGRCSDGGPEHRFECYTESHHDASNPVHIRVACACSAVLPNVVGTPDVCAL